MGPFATEEGLRGRSQDRNGGQRTGAYQFIEFHVLNSRKIVHRHRLGEEGNYKTVVVAAMMELDHSTATNPAVNVIPEHPHSAVTATA